MHLAYSRRAQVRLPSLESYEKQAADGQDSLDLVVSGFFVGGIVEE
jgi:hypothetical protein